FNYINFQGSLRKSGRFGGHNAGVALTETLQPNRLYYFEMYYRPRGVRQRPNEVLEYCLTTPRKHLYFYFTEEQYVKEEDFYEKVAPTFGFTNENLNGEEATDWLQFSTCFQADIPAKHFAISLDRGNFEIEPPCEIDTNDIFSAFHHYHVDLDQFSLQAFPLKVDTSLSLCEGTQINVDLYEISNPPVQEGIDFLWSDGYEGSKRTIIQDGTYEIEARLSCGSFPIALTINATDCNNNFYVPNAFSPNDDNVNDYLQVFLSPEPPISSYLFSVFDRWGSLVYQSNNSQDRWDGKRAGQELPSGQYIWTIQFKMILPAQQKMVQESGTLNLVK
ncbi:MAG: gliding motility-associated C-terminal domain-containing protein, partial [Bacteroidota bacterium]